MFSMKWLVVSSKLKGLEVAFQLWKIHEGIAWKSHLFGFVGRVELGEYIPFIQVHGVWVLFFSSWNVFLGSPKRIKVVMIINARDCMFV